MRARVLRIVVLHVGGTAVVREEQDDRVFANPGAVECRENCPDAVVQVRDARPVLAHPEVGSFAYMSSHSLRLVDRQVDRRVRDVQEERPGPFLLDELDGLPGEQVRDVPLFLDQLAVAVPRPGERPGLVDVAVRCDAARQRAVGEVESVLLRPPFGLESRDATCLPAWSRMPTDFSRGECHCVEREDPLVGGVGAAKPAVEPAAQQGRRVGLHTGRL